MPCLSAFTPTVSRPISSTRGRRPVATRSWSPRTSWPPSKPRTKSSPSRRADVTDIPTATSTPSRRRASPERVAERGWFPGEEVRRGLNDYCFGAQAVHSLGQLDADRATAEHEQAAGHGFYGGRLSVRPDAIQFSQARDGWDDGLGAAGQDHVSGRMPHPVHLDYAGPGQPALAPDEVDVPAGEPAHLALVGVIRRP